MSGTVSPPSHLSLEPPGERGKLSLGELLLKTPGCRTRVSCQGRWARCWPCSCQDPAGGRQPGVSLGAPRPAVWPPGDLCPVRMGTPVARCADFSREATTVIFRKRRRLLTFSYNVKHRTDHLPKGQRKSWGSQPAHGPLETLPEFPQEGPLLSVPLCLWPSTACVQCLESLLSSLSQPPSPPPDGIFCKTVGSSNPSHLPWARWPSAWRKTRL